ncbi:MAG: nitroreductase family protein [Deltaproteobacteria bacterium]|nr:nitroreductase family protein [Deltaproteobacteria bacterium]
MEVLEAIKTRRTVRKLGSEPISDDQLNTILEAIRWTPSWANMQPWEVIVVKDQAVKERLAETLPKGNPALKAMVNAPIVLAICGIKGKSGFYRGEVSTDKGDWFMFDVGAATYSASLAAHELGLGSVIVGLFDAPKAEKILGVPDDKAVVVLLPIGVPEEIPSAPKRKELSEFVYENTYGK